MCRLVEVPKMFRNAVSKNSDKNKRFLCVFMLFVLFEDINRCEKLQTFCYLLAYYVNDRRVRYPEALPLLKKNVNKQHCKLAIDV